MYNWGPSPCNKNPHHILHFSGSKMSIQHQFPTKAVSPWETASMPEASPTSSGLRWDHEALQLVFSNGRLLYTGSFLWWPGARGCENHGLSWSIMVYYSLSWFIMFYHSLSWFSWFIIVFHCLSWFLIVYHGLSWFIIFFLVLSWFYMAYHGISGFIMGISWIIMVYHGLWRYLTVYHGLSCSIMFYHGITWFIIFFMVDPGFWWFIALWNPSGRSWNSTG